MKTCGKGRSGRGQRPESPKHLIEIQKETDDLTKKEQLKNIAEKTARKYESIKCIGV